MAKRFECTVCGYIHEGDTPPEACPVCGVGAEFFTLIDDDALPTIPVPPPAHEPVSPLVLNLSTTPREYRCIVCGHLHTGNAPPGICPVCGVGQEMFELVGAPAEVHKVLAAQETRARWIVLGGGAAAYSALEAAHKAGAMASIVLVHREGSLPYDRMSLTRYLAGDVTRDRLSLVEPLWLAARNVQAIHAEARAIHRDRHVVELDDGRELFYDRLLLATGAHAFVPPIAGVRKEGVHVLRTLADADAVLAKAREGAQCVVVGGGLLGLENAGALARRGVKVTVLEEAPWLLPRQLARPSAERLASYLQGLGLTVRAGVKVSEFVGDETVRGVRLGDGTLIPADIVIVAAGVRPNVELARAAGLTVNRGVVVDDLLCTSDPLIFAAGDVAEHKGIVWGLWTIAMEQGAVAGRALAGEPVRYEAKPPSALLKVLSFPVLSVGRFEELPGDKVLERESEGRYLRVLLAEGAVVGGNLVGGHGGSDLVAALRRAVTEHRSLEQEPELRAVLGAI